MLARIESGWRHIDCSVLLPGSRLEAYSNSDTGDIPQQSPRGGRDWQEKNKQMADAPEPTGEKN